MTISHKSGHRFSFIFVLCTLLMTLVAQPLLAQEATDFEERLKSLDDQLAEQLVAMKIPGFAVAIVKDDKVIFSKGYGQRDIDGNKPVDTKTIFAIGSTSKAFTSALVGMMVDEGKMSWDDPVTKFLPKYKMQTTPADASITIRDLLCHRTGFRRMGLLWAGGSVPMEEVIELGGNAIPEAEFRSKFIYNNVTYMTAGVCSATLEEGDWDAQLARRILKPLGMKDTTTSIEEAKKNERLSLGYKWSSAKGIFVEQPMRNLAAIRPAGSINSHVEDMAQWLRLQLGNGEFAGKRLISKSSMDEMHKQQMAMAPEIGYGLGWMLRTWNGMKVVEHGGNIDGFAAAVGLLPEKNTGFVLLTNVSRTPLQQASIGMIFDALYGDKKVAQVDTKVATVDRSELIGEYKGNFGPFVDTTFKVTEEDEHLFINVPGQMNYELKDPNEKGHWSFAVTDTIYLTFNRNEDGKVMSLTMVQGGMSPEYLRADVEHIAVSTEEVLAPLLGEYQEEKSGRKVTLQSFCGRLVVNAEGKQAFTFKPDSKEKDKWVLRAMPRFLQLQFRRNEDGSVKSVTRIQGGKETDLKRLPDAVESKPKKLTAKEVCARIKKAHGSLDRSKFAGILLRGDAVFAYQGAKGVSSVIASTSGHHAGKIDLGRLALIEEVFDGKHAVTKSTVSPREEFAGVEFGEIQFKYLSWFMPDLIEHFENITIKGEEEVDGELVTVVELQKEDVPVRLLYVSNKSGLMIMEKSTRDDPTYGAMKTTTKYSEFRTVEGLTVATHVVVSSQFIRSLEMKIKTIEALKELPKGSFALPSKD